MKLAGRVALVTGGSRGIGRAIALGLGREGASVAVNYLASGRAAEEVVAEIQRMGRDAAPVQGDVGCADAVESMAKQVLERFGRIDILVNNAGIARDSLLLRMKPEDWEAVVRTNLTGVFNCTRVVARQMIRQRSGRIINVASVVGVTGNTGQANYAAAKAGIIGFTKSVARELASRNITVNAVAPGFIETDMTGRLPREVREELVGRIPLGRSGTAGDVAEVVLFLASDGAGYITGQTFHVDGGMVM